MRCEEFRRKIEFSSNDFQEDLEGHLDSCSSCNSWIQSNLGKPPEGLNIIQLEKPPHDLFMKIKFPISESFFSAYFRKIFVGFSIGTAIAVIWFFSWNPPIPGRNLSFSAYSFLESRESLSEVSFVDFPKSPVTFLGSHSSKDWSFLDSETGYTFLENEKEEDS